MKNLTPPEYLCLTMSCCPGVYKLEDKTPDEYRCFPEFCPSAHDMHDGRVLIVGNQAVGLAAMNNIKVGDDESAVVVDIAMLRLLFPGASAGAREADSALAPSEAP